MHICTCVPYEAKIVYASNHLQHGVIDIHVISSKLGAALHYLHKYLLPGFEVCDAYLNICVL